jgi:Family of unknown function (DUF5681)
MSPRNPPGELGYKRPPKDTQWKKGQCGNPERRRKRVSKGAAALIDEVWQEEVFIVEKGERRRVTVLEAILSQPMFKELSGDSRAAAARLQYQAFIYRRQGPPEIVCENEYQVLGRDLARKENANERL